MKKSYKIPKHEMRRLFYLGIISVFLFSCEKTIPDPYPIHDPDPSKFYANQTILDTIVAISIAFDNDGTAWIGTLHQGLIKYGLTQTKVYNYTNSIINKSVIWDVAVDSKNNVWIGADGLIKFDGDKFYRLSTSNSNIPVDNVWSIAIDSNDDVWVASSTARTGGLAKYNGESFEVFTPENSPLPINATKAVAIDNDNNVWVAETHGVTNSFLVKITDESWTVYDYVNFGQKIYWIMDIDINSNNEVFGAIDYHLSSAQYNYPHAFRFDGISMETFSIDSLSRGYRTIMIDSDDNVWCTYDIGYTFYDGDEWTKTDTEIWGESSVFTIEQAKDGNIWIGKGPGIDIIEKK